ncbi:LodA/GoxA family CTQ-dependent oxidase [Sphingomonas elodea]|uniref:LodA/GoxA family CTQ-dependent oxidase n=1 Tax=Sphingomonas elodea TaxID=179878 RepID=UPI000263167D|nr:LodA/GoxA family CTQ-dependent oxidase [Sphingomonas elodea]
MSDLSVYRIHPAVGIARLGDSPDGFYIAPEKPGQLPIDCDADGNGFGDKPITHFKDAQGRIKRQAARFQIFTYDATNPEGRPLKIGDQVEGGGNSGKLIDIQWRVHLANKKAAWFAFDGLQGEAGYPEDAPLRNPKITDPVERQKLIIDAGPQAVDCTERRKAQFGRTTNRAYATTFPPIGMAPNDIDTLGDLLTDNDGRLLVLGGHGNSGSFLKGFGHPRIDTYANSDGWFDDISDGPVMARLVMMDERTQSPRYIDVEYPAWVLVGYPRYAPEILDMITLDDVVEDMSIREFAHRTDMYGTAGTFAAPQKIDPTDTKALLHWKAGPLQWNPDYRPWFWRDVWPILFRADEFSYLTAILASSNYPHNQGSRGSFDPYRLCIPPRIAPAALARKQARARDTHVSGGLLAAAVEPNLMLLDATAAPGAADAALVDTTAAELKSAAAAFVQAVCPPEADEAPAAYAVRWHQVHADNEAAPDPGYATAKDALDAAVASIIARIAAASAPPKVRLAAIRASSRQEPKAPDRTTDPDEPIAAALRRIVGEFRSGALLDRALDTATAEATTDPGRPYRQYLFDLLRKPGEENLFQLDANPATRTYHLPLMPLLAGDNPITNKTVSKFLRLTDTQLFLLRQWAAGIFIDEVEEGFAPPIDPWLPYASWNVPGGRGLDRGVLANGLGGAFCPGGEVTWIIRNPAIWREPYRIKADPEWYSFTLTAAQESFNRWGLGLGEESYVAYASDPLSQKSNFATGFQPGDLTKLSGLPWQADFNECSTQTIDVTYEAWNVLEPDSVGDTLMAQEQRVWETLWWPAHRPMQVYYPVGTDVQLRAWARGIPQTLAGDLKMVTEWSKLGFVRRNPQVDTNQPSPNAKYICVEYSGDIA